MRFSVAGRVANPSYVVSCVIWQPIRWLDAELITASFVALVSALRDGWEGRSTRPTPPQRPEFDEAALIAAAQKGHLPSFNQLILHYQSLAYNVAYRVMGDNELAADATQDAFIKAFQRLDQYRGGSFKAWLLRIVTNTCYDVLRARRRRPPCPWRRRRRE